jgi:hypothetical protein
VHLREVRTNQIAALRESLGFHEDMRHISRPPPLDSSYLQAYRPVSAAPALRRPPCGECATNLYAPLVSDLEEFKAEFAGREFNSRSFEGQPPNTPTSEGSRCLPKTLCFEDLSSTAPKTTLFRMTEFFFPCRKIWNRLPGVAGSAVSKRFRGWQYSALTCLSRRALDARVWL